VPSVSFGQAIISPVIIGSNVHWPFMEPMLMANMKPIMRKPFMVDVFLVKKKSIICC
jgi:hypothetical protein